MLEPSLHDIDDFDHKMSQKKRYTLLNAFVIVTFMAVALAAFTELVIMSDIFLPTIR